MKIEKIEIIDDVLINLAIQALIYFILCFIMHDEIAKYLITTTFGAIILCRSLMSKM